MGGREKRRRKVLLSHCCTSKGETLPLEEELEHNKKCSFCRKFKGNAFLMQQGNCFNHFFTSSTALKLTRVFHRNKKSTRVDNA